MNTVAVAIFCKTPLPGKSKTRLSPPLRPEECADLSACFIRDLARTVGELAKDDGVTPYALYTPQGSEAALLRLLPDAFDLMPQCDGDFGQRLLTGVDDFLNAGHQGAILLNSDSPTLPLSILRAAVAAVRKGNNVVLSPAHDGGYTLIGLSAVREHLFENVPWSTEAVYRTTLDRARDIDLPVVSVPGWYDVDDRASLDMLEAEFEGHIPPFALTSGSDAPATRGFMAARRKALVGAA